LLLLVACQSDLDVPVDKVYEVPAVRVRNAGCIAPLRALVDGPVVARQVFAEVLADPADVRRAIQLVQSPVDSMLWYLVLQHGRVLVFDEETGAEDPGVFVDLKDRLWLGHHEVGLVSMAFHPEYEVNRHVFVVYSAPSERYFVSRLSRFEALDHRTLDPDSEEVILEVEQPSGSHSGNHVAFGPDGFLYFALGDGRNGDATGNAQNTATLAGSILRLDVDRADGVRDKPYSIPVDNPFAAGGGAPEIFAYGLRNTWRFSFDQQTGDLWAGDVGLDTREEINVIVGGGNYGWDIKEGDLCHGTTDCDESGLVEPVVAFSHAEGRSVTGGHVYHGDQIPDLTGRYVYGDYVTGAIWTVDADVFGVPESRLWLESGKNISSFTLAQDGALYFLHYSTKSDGAVYRLEPSPRQVSSFPTTLSATGCLDPSDLTTPKAGVLEYDVIAELWSDGARKERYLAIPDDRRISVDDQGNLLFPVGTVLIKHFSLEGRMLETRLLMQHVEGDWVGYSYEWNEAGSDATLLREGKTKTLPGGAKWHFPSRRQCTECHTAVVGRSLGPELLQLDDELLSNMLAQGMFVPGLETIDDLGRAALPQMPDPFGDAPLERRARAYLHANCAYCHQPGGTGQGPIDLRYTVPEASTQLCDVRPENGYLYQGENSGLRIIVPNEPELSILYLRMRKLDKFRMPPLATLQVDQPGTALIGAWIESMDVCP
jgi:uncharacterized repeat protein (TIGR03806 family)